jgi:hypothetical protein
MKHSILALLVLICPSFAPAVPQKNESAAAPQGLMKPGPQHAMLRKLVGTWDAVVKNPSGGEMTNTATMTRTSDSPFHTIDIFEGDMMGSKFVGHAIHGYCPIKKKFYSYWTDSMTPSPLTLEGDYDEKKKELTMTGTGFGMSGKLEPCRSVTQFEDDDHYTWALYGTGPDGKEAQHMTIEFTRKK